MKSWPCFQLLRTCYIIFEFQIPNPYIVKGTYSKVASGTVNLGDTPLVNIYTYIYKNYKIKYKILKFTNVKILLEIII